MTRALVLLLAALLAAPSVAATWFGVGTQEPDTEADETGSRMWSDASVSPTQRRVYFDVFPTVGGPAAGSPSDGAVVNPNVAQLGTRIAPFGLVQYRALLGEWKDCNRDGYIGLADAAVQEYRVEAGRVDTTLCPAVAVPDIIPEGWRPSHNDGQWVAELLTIGMVDPCEFKGIEHRQKQCTSRYYGVTAPDLNTVPGFTRNSRVIYSNDTYIWGDDGAPGAPPPPACNTPPFLHGTTASTGALLGVADCQMARIVAKSVNTASDAADPSNSLRLRFEDPNDPGHSSSVLNQRFPVNLFGEPGRPGLLQRDSGDASVTMWDCGDPRGTRDVRDPTAPPGQRGQVWGTELVDPSGGALTGPLPSVPILGYRTVFADHDGNPNTPGVLRVDLEDSRGSYAWVPATQPEPTVNDPIGSWWDAADILADGVGPTGDCDPETHSTLHEQYPGTRVEGDRQDLGTGHRDHNDHTFFFFDGYRGHSSVNPHARTHTLPDDGGIVFTRNLYGGPMWSTIAHATRDPQFVDRSDAQPTGAQYASFYALLNASAIVLHGWSLPSSSTATYGAEACGTTMGPGASDKNGWVCDATRWYKDPFGNDITPRYAEGKAIGRLPGELFHLRDVDCWDGELARDSDVRASGSLVSGQVCN